MKPIGRKQFRPTRVFLRVSLAVVATQLPIPVLGQTGWQPCGAGTCVTSGNVGIGTTSPGYKLQVLDSTKAIIAAEGTYGAQMSGSGSGFGLFGSNLYVQEGTQTLKTAGNHGSYGYSGVATWWGYLALYANAGIATTADATVAPAPRMFINGSNGNVGIGTTAPQYRLAVNGTIGAKEVIVTNTGWADHVLRPEYALKPLSQVEAYIHDNQRLPDMPSEADAKDKGVGLAEMQVKLLAKIEELTLHVIELDKRNKALEAKVAMLQGTPGR